MRETIKQFEQDGYQVTVSVDGGECGSPWFQDLYTESEHIAGTTIQVPDRLQNGGPKYYIGQTTPAELARDYAKQGRENPSRAAYESLQKELGWYITAADYSLHVEVEKAGVTLADCYGIGFEFSWEYAEDDLEDYALKHIVPDHGDELIAEAMAEAKSTLTALCA